MNETLDSYSLIIATDETTALILGEALTDWNLGIHLPDGAGAATAAVSRTTATGLVLSGILEKQYEAVRSAYAGRGFDEQESLVLEGWKTGCFGRTLSPGAPTGGMRAGPALRSQP
jgi:hypothetical protein